MELIVSSQSAKQEQALGVVQFFSKSTICVVDESSASRTRLANILIKLGAKSNLIRLQGSYEEALECFKQDKPTVVLSEYYLNGSKSGFDLLASYRKLCPENRTTLFVLITSNGSESAVAQAAEEDIDTFVVKPYTLHTLSRSLINALVQKLFPSPYIQLIEKGKKLLFAGQAGEAIPLFTQASQLDPKPSLACFYLGQAHSIQKALDSAQGHYETGLSFNLIHYKCLVGLYHLFVSKAQDQEAYKIVRKIAKYFPANPERLAAVIRLAIKTGNYMDLDEYYQVFVDLEKHEPELVKNMCAGLIVIGRYFLNAGNIKKGSDFLNAAAVSCAGNSKFLCAIVEALARHGLKDIAEIHLKRFPASETNGLPYKAARFLVDDLSNVPLRSIETGKQLIKEGVRYPAVYLAVARRMAEVKMKNEAVQLIEGAFALFPSEKSDLEEFLWTLNG